MMQWQVGDVKVTLVRDAMASVPVGVMYPNSEPGVVTANADWLAPYMNEDGSLGFSVHALVLDTGKQVIMVDTCNGTHANSDAEYTEESWPFLADLSASGYAAEDIDVVLCTHLHNDHVGWNTRFVDGKWVPTFPNARYLFGRVEYEHWDTAPADAVSSFDDAVRPVVAAGLSQLVEMDHRICDEVRLDPSPGHSPGHVCVHIESAGAKAVITGDALHHPIQFAAPHWRMFLDYEPEQAVATRTALCDRVADTPTRVFGTHFPDPSSGFVVRAGDGAFRFDPSAPGAAR